MSAQSDGLPPLAASRACPPAVIPIIHAGVRYEPLNATAAGLTPGGYIIATNIESGERLWMRCLYKSILIPHLETDVQMSYFRSMKIDTKQEILSLEDEKRRLYRIALKDGALC